MGEDIKIYHVETQEDYDDLMIELEEQGYEWISGNKPTKKPEYWSVQKENTTVLLNRFQNYRMTRGALNYHKRTYPLTPIIKHKVKGVEQMEKVVAPQFVVDWYEGFRCKSLRLVLNHLMSCEDQRIMEWVDKNSPRSAQEIIAKMYLFQDYEVEEEEKKYYWRKKKEYCLGFETEDEVFIRYYYKKNKMYLGNRPVYLFLVPSYEPYKTKFTEKEVRELVSEEDFNKLERVEVDE